MSVEEFGDYHLALEYKWGQTAVKKKKESGLIYQSVGKRGELMSAWMYGIEFDISNSGAGGLYALSGVSAKVASEQVDERSSRYVPGSPMRTIEQNTTFRCFPLEGRRGNNGGWVRVDLYVVGNSARHYIDGELVLELQDAGIEYRDQSWKALKKGKLQIQSESTEILFRKIRIAEIKAFPDI